jgi:beta-phosphoglucomutase-like phosphatase (HAD superfamily)
VESAKPSPDLYLSVLQHLGVPAVEAMAFEDSPNGIAAAKAAGIFCVAVPNRLTEGLDLSRADMCLESLSQISLPELLGLIADRSAEARGASGRSTGQ